MKKIIQFSVPIILILFVASILSAGCGEKKTEDLKVPSKHLPPVQQIPSFVADTTKKDNSIAKSEGGSIVRHGMIDLKAIDRNSDGNVYECQMDYNVISDNPGTCPECKMDLEKVSLKKAKENLKASDFQVK